MFLLHDKIYKTADENYYTEEYMLHNGSISGNAWNRGSVVTEIEPADDVRHEFGSGKIIHCNYLQLFRDNDNIISCNNIAKDFKNFDIVSGTDYCEDTENYADIYQWYLIDNTLADNLKRHTNEIVYYHNELGIYVLRVTQWGTSWDYVCAEFIM